jgi:uncharacterized lipoprotein YehR (DUF1307 family)
MRNIKKVLLVTVSLMLVISLSGCAQLYSMLGEAKGDLVGRSFVISEYDHYANKTLQVSGTKVTVGLLENSANFSTEDTGFKSEVLEITINGDQLLQVGNTVVFAEEGLDMVEDYEVPDTIETESGGGFVPFDRYVNDIKNSIGKPKTIIISSQMGIPIGVYQGNEVYVTVPSDLPKMTLLNIDGKALYIHRANYTIVDTNLIK